MKSLMEICYSVGTRRHLQLGISLFIFLCSTFSCMPSEVDVCDFNVDCSKLNANSFPVFNKYIMESYFHKYRAFLDSDFQKFVAHELPLGLCEAPLDNMNLVPRLSVLEHSLIGEGSHRSLSSSIRFKIQPETISEIAKPLCKVIIIERLPSGVFADPFELQHLLERGVFSDVAVFGDTNLELPATLSNRSIVEVHIDVGFDILLREKNGIEINIKLPLHVRYPPLGDNGFSEVGFGAPDLFVQRNSADERCLLKSVNENAELKSTSVVWMVPSGMKAHTGFVSVATFLGALLLTLFIVLASICHSDIK